MQITTTELNISLQLNSPIPKRTGSYITSRKKKTKNVHLPSAVLITVIVVVEEEEVPGYDEYKTQVVSLFRLIITYRQRDALKSAHQTTATTKPESRVCVCS